MRHAIRHIPAGDWPQAEARASVTLAYDDRHRRRMRMVDDAGEPFLLDLPDAVRMNHDDGLLFDTGGYVRVQAAEEAVADLRCRSLTETARVAWHVGNRHIPVQVLDDGTLRIRDDHVIVDMATRLGAVVERRRAPFAPEAGAYAAAAENGHGHGHQGHSHGHAHGHEH